MRPPIAVLVLVPFVSVACEERPRAPDGIARDDQQPTPDARMMGGSRMMEHGGMMEGGGMVEGGMGEMMGNMPEWMMSGGGQMGRDTMRDMHVIRGLLMSHEKIRRAVEDIPGGVRTVTTSSDPDTTRLIRTHVRQMKERMDAGRPIRRMDPLFRELFEHHENIEMNIEDVPGGVRVIETSDDPRVVALIRQHARRAVSEFVEGGMRRAMRPTPLPQGYRPTKSGD